MKTTSWPPADNLDNIPVPSEPAVDGVAWWAMNNQFEYHLVLVVAAILIILGVARIVWSTKKSQ